MICFNFSEDETLLHETTLATEHGMSRTPIRQILQRLAYERLVYTKSGVGTVVVPLKNADRYRDFTTHRGVLAAARLHEFPDLTLAQQSEIIALGAMLDAMQDPDLDGFYTLMQHLHGIVSALITDPLLQSTVTASNWRITRWKLKSAQEDPAQVRKAFSDLINDISKHRPGSGADVLGPLCEGSWLDA